MNACKVLAIDLGSGSGRGIWGALKNGRIECVKEVYRFKNGFIQINGGIYWDYVAIYRGILDCLRACKKKDLRVDSLSIDGWSQDYAYLSANGEVLGLPRSYRDPVNRWNNTQFEDAQNIAPMAFSRASGASRASISTLRQLWYDRNFRKPLFEAADKVLHIPYLMVYLLTGETACDPSLLSIGELGDVRTMHGSQQTYTRLGVTGKMPVERTWGSVIGRTNRSVHAETEIDAIPVICTMGHDTSSAVSAIPDDGEFLWVSSGSYNMLGAVLRRSYIDDRLLQAGFSNTPLDDGRVCVMAGSGGGMYYAQQCMKRWQAYDEKISYPSLTEYALEHRTKRTFLFEDVPDEAENMPKAIQAAIRMSGFEISLSPQELYEAFCNGMATAIARKLVFLEETIGKRFGRVYIIGGGSQAHGVNIRLAERMQKDIYTGLTEASALGNLLAQGIDMGAIGQNWRGKLQRDLFQMRRF